MHTLIIGYGNPLRGDDGIGWQIAQLLCQDPPAGVHVLACHQLTIELAEPVSAAQRVIFIDACQDGVAGTLAWYPLEIDRAADPLFSHHVNPAALLACALYLYGACPADATMLAISGACFGYTDQLSPALTAALPALLARILAFTR